jgi:hypothetical protein
LEARSSSASLIGYDSITLAYHQLVAILPNIKHTRIAYSQPQINLLCRWYMGFCVKCVVQLKRSFYWVWSGLHIISMQILELWTADLPSWSWGTALYPRSSEYQASYPSVPQHAAVGFVPWTGISWHPHYSLPMEPSPRNVRYHLLKWFQRRLDFRSWGDIVLDFVDKRRIGYAPWIRWGEVLATSYVISADMSRRNSDIR